MKFEVGDRDGQCRYCCWFCKLGFRFRCIPFYLLLFSCACERVEHCVELYDILCETLLLVAAGLKIIGEYRHPVALGSLIERVVPVASTVSAANTTNVVGIDVVVGVERQNEAQP